MGLKLKTVVPGPLTVNVRPPRLIPPWRVRNAVRLLLVMATSLAAIKCRLMVWPAVTFEATEIEAGLAPLSSVMSSGCRRSCTRRRVFSKAIEPTVTSLSSVTVRLAVMTLPKRAVTPWALGTVAGFQLPAVFQLPEASTFQVKVCAEAVLTVPRRPSKANKTPGRRLQRVMVVGTGSRGGDELRASRLYECSQVGCLLLENSDPF